MRSVWQPTTTAHRVVFAQSVVMTSAQRRISNNSSRETAFPVPVASLPPGQETETTIATFGTPVVITTPETVTTMAAPSTPVPTTPVPGETTGSPTETPECANPKPKCGEIGEALKNCEGAQAVVDRCIKETCGSEDVCSFVTDAIRLLQVAYDKNQEICASISAARRAVRKMRRLTDCDDSPAIPACKSAKWRRRYASPPLPRTCSYPFRSDESVGANNLDVMCVCIPGYVLKPSAGPSGMDCVPVAECGCRYGTQYLEIGEYYEDKDTCTGTQLCSAFNTIVPANKSCVENAECKDGKCVCEEGFMGNGVELCEKEIDYPEKRCVESYDSVAGINRLTCECKMGYASTCETCVDIDECANSNECGPGTKCFNLPGSYQCDCKTGFTRESNTTCKDIKECENNPCPENSICYEGEGSYYCKCCEGFQKNGDKCEAIDKSNPPNKCCTCVLAQCSVAPNGNADAGCYVDNGEETSYDSFHTAFIYRCIKNLPFKVDDYKYRPCTTPVETVTTTTPGALPTTTPAADTTTQPPDPCRDTVVCNLSDENDKTIAPVCSENNVKFPNLCAFKQAECRGNNNSPPQELPAYTRGECPTTTPPPTSPDPTSPFDWGPWGAYEPCDAPDCDTPGKRTRERDYTLNPGAPDIVPPESERVSFISCKKPGCTPKPTAAPTTVVPDKCEFLQCGSEINPVCGAIANGSPTTYDSECRLKERACDSTPRSIYRVVSRSKCPDKEGEPEPPKLCNDGPVLKKVQYNITRGAISCFYEAEMNVCESLQCVSPAGSTSSSICCKGVTFAAEKVSVNALCTDNSFEMIRLSNPETCACQDEGGP
ncbi:fibrillin-1-like [Haliotis rubra]|uniref:fibrillin-1-like n=1 Tax=Haliotis rubra TaxID=36100 RepID=UPI001EE4F47D|nr:fibrillin-1-like [Haliotis rubra]